MAFPSCVQCGTRQNPCRCKVVGPTLGFVAFLVTGVIEWPVGAVVYIFKHSKGRRIMGHPATVITKSLPFESTYLSSKLCISSALTRFHYALSDSPRVFRSGTRSYANERREDYNLFGNMKPGDDDFKKAWEKEMENDDDDDTLWSGSEDEYNANTQQESGRNRLEKETRMRDPNFKFTPEIKLKPESKLVPRKKWQKAQSRRRKAQKRLLVQRY
ncbi:hypothetical protein F2Q70_00005972 [Brassica cretica]|uniref:Uncharacterized protein n=2 Tax=Brassica cretica TaxID=69181 RepID=A0A8S9ILN9_BRACR|nr:hypothetical protein F2Q68_00022575 [Brassica cretica]KAF2571090.1 hypothetical protein F2Q70_00005972 [Brassica cretica]KAF3561696.1 hypothetical protein DY000_02018752 [Brassica cretica]